MNIFYLSKIPKICASMHCDKHVTKMLIEYAQMMSTAHHVLDDEPDPNLYKVAHLNHPSTIWVRSSKQNYLWMYKTWEFLHAEYQRRYGKEHLSFTRLNHLLCKAPDRLGAIGFFPPPLCMPEHYKTNDPIQSYRRFYLGDKSKFATWKSPAVQPNWYKRAL